MELKGFMEKVIEVEVVWFGEKIAMGIRPGVWTTERLVSMLAPMADTDADRIRNAEAIADTIAWWDITEDGERWPVTAENVAKLPQGLITAIPDALAEKVRAEGKT